MASNKKSSKKSQDIRKSYYKKPVRSQRGVAETYYGEVKAIKAFSLTPCAAALLKNLSGELNISMSELLERFARTGHEFKDALSQEVRAEDLPSHDPEAFNNA